MCNKLIIILNENWYFVSKLLEWYLQVKNLKFELSSCIGSRNRNCFIAYVSVQCFFTVNKKWRSDGQHFSIPLDVCRSCNIYKNALGITNIWMYGCVKPIFFFFRVMRMWFSKNIVCFLLFFFFLKIRMIHNRIGNFFWLVSRLVTPLLFNFLVPRKYSFAIPT